MEAAVGFMADDTRHLLVRRNLEYHRETFTETPFHPLISSTWSLQVDFYVVQVSENNIDITTTTDSDDFNRLWVRLWADIDEQVWGAGEQYSYLDLRGRHYPIWTSEQGESAGVCLSSHRHADESVCLLRGSNLND